MNKLSESSWVSLVPDFGRFQKARKLYRQHAQLLQHWLHNKQNIFALIQIKSKFLNNEVQIRREIWPVLKAAGLLLSDLVEQGWDIRIREQKVQVLPPQLNGVIPKFDKDIVRNQELIKRNAQLRSHPVREFISVMERKRLFDNQFVSIFSLMRDGRDLAEKLSYAAKHATNGNGHSLLNIIQPYIQFVDNRTKCQFTGLRLMDIWRYFRHTWVNQYTSVPGRTMTLLVRDAAAPFHPVIGIAALSSPIIQLNERDRWIGWLPETFLDELYQHPTKEMAEWLTDIVDTAINELYVRDFIKDALIKRKDLKYPNEIVIQGLLKEGVKQRKAHHRYTDRRQYEELKNSDPHTVRTWVDKAETHLFRSKRAIALADYLNARLVLNKYFSGEPSIQGLRKMLVSSSGKKVISRIVRKAKADRVGIAMADISVCGAIAPYKEILGGKLVSMLVTSTEVINEYKRRYTGVYSEIASSMAGRPIARPSNLVLLGTTSLYGANSSQYNRIKIPTEFVGGEKGNLLKYIRVGKSESFGTSHYSNETIEALVALVIHRKGGQRVNSIFGEGSSPKLRKVREGIESLGIESEALLKHGRKRIIYAIPLVRNLKKYLLGINKRPQFYVPLKAQHVTQRICEWWILRWLKMRIQNENAILAIAQHTLIEPIRHDARVKLNSILTESDSDSRDQPELQR